MTTPERILSYDIVRANAPYRTALLHATEAVLASGQLILGDRLAQFEQDFASYCGVTQCIGTGNGLDALVLILRALGIGNLNDKVVGSCLNDGVVASNAEVIVPAFTFIATWLAASHIGAIPVAVDVTHDALIDPALIEAAITPRTRAIIPVHLYGRLADMDAILAIGRRHGIPVIEDAAQAHGSLYTGKRAGSFGIAAAFSFYPAKNLGALGDGGAISTSDDALAARIRSLRNYGSTQKYQHEILGQNSRLDELQAAYLTIKLAHLDVCNARRAAVAQRYLQAFAEMRSIELPDPCASTVWHQFVIRTHSRNHVQQSLAAHGVDTMVHYPTTPFNQPCYVAQYHRAHFPVAAQLANTVLSLPMADYLTDDEVSHVIRTVQRSVSASSAAAQLSAS
jgi:dTDP-4-amino-4,6-dideoxygalactose transaminase